MLRKLAFRLSERVKAADPRARRRNRRARAVATADGTPLPPERLVVLVAGSPDLGWFLDGGRLAAESIQAALARAGVEIGSLEAMLDFGCGCGRVLRHWASLDGPVIAGADYNAELVAWCRCNLSFAEVVTNNALPPLPFEAGSFDLVYALSVFTHLPEELQHSWLRDLRRVLRPGGHLLLTTQGAHYCDVLSPTEREEFDRGHLVVRYADAAGMNLCSAFHPEAYIRDQLAVGFDIVEFVPEGATGNPFQDLVLLCRPPE